uniref:Putative transcription factor n=1 Tax=Penicillium expansum TaxID=27334 RepID=A8KNC3_PENEN|nr:putative transcription factor [Penicillium expansum]
MDIANETSVMSSRRRRPTLAYRCNREVPCNQCIRSKSEYCVYIQIDDDECSVQRHLKRKRTNPEQVHQFPRREKEDSHTYCEDVPSSEGVSPVFRTGFEPPRPESVVSTPTEITHKGICSNGSSSSEDGSGVLPIRGIFLDSRFFGPSHWINSAVHVSESRAQESTHTLLTHGVEQFRKVHTLQRSVEKEPGGNLYRQCRELAETRRSQNSIPQLLVTNMKDLIPPQAITDQLIQAYLRTFESVLRVLHVPLFLHECQGFWERPLASSEDFQLQLLLVISIGALFSPKLRDSCNESVWIHIAESRLLSNGGGRGTGLTSVQNFCLLMIARLVSPYHSDSDLVGLSVESLMQAAMRIGLHISPKMLPQMSFYEQELRRRLWSTVLEISLQFSIEIGAVPLIPMDGVDFELPLNVPDESFDQNTETEPTSKPPDDLSHTSIQIFLMESFPVRLEIARMVNCPRREIPYQRLLQLSSRLSAHCRSTQARLNVGNNKAQSQKFPVRLLNMFMYRYLLALHVPFALKASTDPTLYFSRKVSLEVALSLLDHSTGPDEDDYVRVMIIGSGVMSSSLNLAILVVSAELLDMLENEMSALTPISSAMNRQPLRKILDENIELISRRISQGQPDIEVSMLFAGLTAQIDAAQTGQPADDAIIDAFHRCLSENFNTLKTRILDHQLLDPILESTTGCFDLLNNAWDLGPLPEWVLPDGT